MRSGALAEEASAASQALSGAYRASFADDASSMEHEAKKGPISSTSLVKQAACDKSGASLRPIEDRALSCYAGLAALSGDWLELCRALTLCKCQERDPVSQHASWDSGEGHGPVRCCITCAKKNMEGK